MNISIPIIVSISCEDCSKTYYADAIVTKPDGLLYDQVQKDGRINGLIVECDVIMSDLTCVNNGNVASHDIRISFDQNNIKIVDSPTGITYKDSDENNSDLDENNNSDSDGNNELDDSNSDENNELDDLFSDIKDTIVLKIDTHWNCYCKTRNVCGCGCEPKHDGW
jgi:hypothetical protein